MIIVVGEVYKDEAFVIHLSRVLVGTQRTSTPRSLAMETVNLSCLLTFSLFISLSLAKDNSDSCGKGTFQLSLFGKKQDDDQWNTTYNVERSSCKPKKNWNLVLFQNITDHGSTQHIHLHGYFTENIHSSGMNGSHKFAFDGVQVDSPENATLSSSEVCKGSKFTGDLHVKVVPRSEWKARSSTKLLHAVDHPAKSMHFYQRSSNCSTHQECVLAIQRIQEREMPSRGDIFANFISAGDGRIYEGIGWDRSMDSELNFKYLTNGSSPPSQQQLASVAVLVREGMTNGIISEDSRMTGSLADMTKKWITWMGQQPVN